MFIVLPVCMLLLGLVFASQFKVTPENHQIILNEIKRLESGGNKQDADAKTKAVCELLIGKSIADCSADIPRVQLFYPAPAGCGN